MRIDQLYQDIIISHYKNPQGRGLREPYQGQAHHVNPTCGDEVTLRVNVVDGQVADVSYEGQGCSISQASASVLHELVTGRSVDDAMGRHEAFVTLVGGRGTVTPDEDLLEDGVAFAGVAKYPARVKCALLPWMAFKDATVRAVAAAGPALPGQPAGTGPGTPGQPAVVPARPGEAAEPAALAGNSTAGLAGDNGGGI